MHFRQCFLSSDALWKHNFDPVLKLTGCIQGRLKIQQRCLERIGVPLVDSDLNKFNQIAVAFSLRTPARDNFPIAAAKFFTHSHKIIYNIQTYSNVF